MIYRFEKLSGNLYAIEMGERVYGLLLEIAIAHIEGQKVLSCVYLLDENENVICKEATPFGFVLKSFREGCDVVKDMLEGLAEQANKITGVDLLETFDEIRKDMKRN